MNSLNQQPEGVKQAIDLLKKELRNYLVNNPNSIAADMDRDLGVYAKGGYLLWTILEMMEAEGTVSSHRRGNRRYFNLT